MRSGICSKKECGLGFKRGIIKEGMNKALMGYLYKKRENAVGILSYRFWQACILY